MAIKGSTEPRIYTGPLWDVDLDDGRHSLGHDVIRFAELVLFVTLLPWQKWLLIHALELLPDGHLRFRNIVVLVARQNGKSTLSQVLALWMMYVHGVKLVIGTAQDLDTAEGIWQEAVDLIVEEDENDLAVRPGLNAMLKRVVMTNGKKSLELTGGEKYKVKAATRRAGRSLSGDLILLDELREHQTWDAWGAITKTTMARAHAQIWSLSNAGDALSIVLRYLRQLGHAALGDPDKICLDDVGQALPVDDDLAVDDDTFAIFEWSAAPQRAVHDRQGWAEANPSLGYPGMITEGTVASACRTDPEWVFRTEVLCQWNAGTIEGAFPAGTWTATQCLPDENGQPTSRISPDSPLAVCVDMDYDRATAYIAFAGYRDDGLVHFEVVAARPGTDWILDWLTERHARRAFVAVTCQAKGAPISKWYEELDASKLPSVPWEGGSLSGWTGQFYDAIRYERARHIPQPVLDVAAGVAVTKPLGEAWVWNRRQSPAPVGSLVAATGAVGALLNAPRRIVSAYEDDGLMVV